MSSYKTIYSIYWLDFSQSKNNQKEEWGLEWIHLIVIFPRPDLSLQVRRQIIRWTLIQELQMKNLKKKTGHVPQVIMIKEKLFASFQNLNFGMKKIWVIMLTLQSTVSNSQVTQFLSDSMMWKFLKLSLSLFHQKEVPI